MASVERNDIVNYVEANIGKFHQRRLEGLEKLTLKKVLKRKNPCLFKAKYIQIAGDLIRGILDAFLSSQEEAIFGGFLEELAVFICTKAYGGRKSSTEGIDLEFERENKRYIVSIKSGPNWGNSSQIKKMCDYFRKAKRVLRTNSTSNIEIIAVNGCCYGQHSRSDKGDYLKLCGQRFWSLVSGDDNLYLDIIEPLGHKAKAKNKAFCKEYAKVVNKLTMAFSRDFCDEDGLIIWEKVVRFNSAATD